MFTKVYYPLEGHNLLIADGFVILLILISHHLYIPGRRSFWSHAVFGLCWSVIVVAAAIMQGIR
jgi:hypothetical protein